jgi:hypothetical protein
VNRQHAKGAKKTLALDYRAGKAAPRLRETKEPWFAA